MSKKQVEIEGLPVISKQKFVTLTLTNACNLNCIYCYEHGKDESAMDLEIAEKILKDELNSDDGYEFVHVDFFGGEPFIAFKRMCDIVDYLKANKFKKSYIINITTNGTLVQGEKQAWLTNNRDIVRCGLSWDGTPEMQNYNRSNSASMVDLDFFAKTYPLTPIKMTISPKTLETLYDGVVYLHKKGFQVFCNLAYGEDWSDAKYESILETQLSKLMSFYLENPEVPICSMLGDKISQIATKAEASTIRSWCAAGTQTCAYDVNGKKYPCQFFMPLSNSGNAKSASNIQFFKEIPIEKFEGECRDCILKSACPTCYGYNFSTRGSIYARDPNICKLTKLILRARSFFWAQAWEKGILKIDESEEQALLRSIILIQKNT